MLTARAAIDLSGYGLSDQPLEVAYDCDFFADVLDGFLDALGIDDTHLVVHDLGGPIGLCWALRHAGHVRKLILNTLVYPEISWAVKLFPIASRTPGVRDSLVSPKGIVRAMKFSVVHKDRLTLEAPLRLIYGENDRILPDIAKTMQRVQHDRRWHRAHRAPGLRAKPRKHGKKNRSRGLTELDTPSPAGGRRRADQRPPVTPSQPIEIASAFDGTRVATHWFMAFPAPLDLYSLPVYLR